MSSEISRFTDSRLAANTNLLPLNSQDKDKFRATMKEFFPIFHAHILDERIAERNRENEKIMASIFYKVFIFFCSELQ